jgi:hypothetical protein
MHKFITIHKDDNLEISGTKGEIIAFVEPLDADDVEGLEIVEFDTDEGTSSKVTEDIAREIADAHEFHVWDGDLSSETNIPAIAMKWCEDELRERLQEECDEYKTRRSDEAVFMQGVA